MYILVSMRPVTHDQRAISRRRAVILPLKQLILIRKAAVNEVNGTHLTQA